MHKIWQKTVLFMLICFLFAGTAFAAPTQVIAGGNAIGLSIDAGAVIVTDFTEEARSPAAVAGIAVGDVILACDRQPIETTTQLLERMAELHGEAVCLTVQRDGAILDFTVQPERTQSGWRLGLMVKDRINGIGTLTYYDPETGRFGALGHRVNVQGSESLRTGEVLGVRIVEVRRSERGAPGALLGAYTEEEAIGAVDKNLRQGVFGVLYEAPEGGRLYPVAAENEIERGEATILCTLEGQQIGAYQIEITDIRSGDENDRDLRLHVTDPMLLEQSGGIIQGISGAPILQNGKLVGAVTHVLVDRPERGYGIAIGKMLTADEEDEF